LRPPQPLFFPDSEAVPESSLHLRLRTALFLVLEHRLNGRAFVGSDQFVYWDPTDPRACLAPDAIVRLGGPLALLRSFKVWEHGAPNLAVEILSPDDSRDRNFALKLARYARCGVAELASFDPENEEQPLRLWDLVDGDLVERDLSEPSARFCETLAAYWVVAPDPVLGTALRVADDPQGNELWPTAAEAGLLAAEAAQAEKEAERAEKEAERAEKEAALARVAELERELERHRSDLT
jgi:Uma2 family endonuclease